MTALLWTLWIVSAAALALHVLANGTYTLQLLLSVRDIRTARAREQAQTGSWWYATPRLPTVAAVLPAYDEAASIVESVRGALTLAYPDLDIVVVNDGSDDDTLARLVDAFDLTRAWSDGRPGDLPTAPVHGYWRSDTHPNLVVVDKANGGKADALNAGINATASDLIVSLDADTVVAPDALLRLARGFLRRPDAVAVGGTVRPVNGDTVRDGRVVAHGTGPTWLATVQQVEYLRAFFLGRLGWNRLGQNTVISGAFGMFDRAAVVAAGGYATDSVGEDFELVVRLRRRAYDRPGTPGQVVFLPDAVAYTQTPDDRATLRNQRSRWHRGMLDTLATHRSLLLRRRYGWLGSGSLLHFAVVEAAGPLVEIVGLAAAGTAWAAGVLQPWWAPGFLAAAYLWSVAVTVSAIAVDVVLAPGALRVRDRARQVAAAFLEPVWLRPLTLVWRVTATVRWARGSGKSWGHMARTGFQRLPG